ncbi:MULTISPECIES: hypothetical protein [unclassified Rhodococcus (in: high G+C Gram-positive bacteria)]|uniref:hypothetical protein n=1 Tax=unclassified Rhodococcus (in: high G+C Gram-positive bacteria) TaxID=192944 RepID=UPI0007BB8525|nr:MULTISPECIES: hypothetical protein [unclassified Rhodococcus (in: high G+C Gram-positive bacteria)]KZF03649.1 hypothetical protein A2J04_26615 [Rhodococcus sp. EPR-279]KZF05008.1 hypothetical protein A2J02_24820 [Rhodococcus sp. EPR-147]
MTGDPDFLRKSMTGLELPWDPVEQRRFALLLRSASLLNRVSPPVVRAFPFNILLRDVERRMCSGRALV